MILTIVDHDPTWSHRFIDESTRCREALGDGILEVRHVGSTAVPGLPAKPKIDMCFESPHQRPPEWAHQRMVELGYSLSEHSEQLGHAAYNLDHKLPAYTIHWYGQEHPEIHRLVWFRDQLRGDPQLCAEYARIKRQAMDTCEGDRWTYNQHKASFIQQVLSQYEPKRHT